MVVWLYGWKFFKVSHFLANFGGHKPCDSKDIIDLIVHVTFQDHLPEEPCDLVEESSSFYIPALSSPVVIGIVVVDI